MQIEKARELGFCPGVKRAIELVEREARERGPLQTLGPLVHNQQVVDRLKAKGVGVAQSVDTINVERVAITAHGVAPSVLEELRSRGLEIVDATCPIVHRAQFKAQRLAEAGYYVIVFGDNAHTEVQGLLGWAGASAIATLTPPDWGSPPRRISIISQTTQSHTSFARFIGQLVTAAVDSVSELRIANTICPATRRRQQAALALARRVDLMIVIGGRDSANTQHLVQSCATTGVDTYHVETAAEIAPSWIDNHSRIGVTAGASTPDQVIDEVIAKLSDMAHGKQQMV